MQGLTLSIEESKYYQNNLAGLRTEMEKSVQRPVRKWQKLLQLCYRICLYLYTRLQLREMKFSIMLQGRLRLSGTRNIAIGRFCAFGKQVQLSTENYGYIHIGSQTRIGTGVKISSRNNITIEDSCYIADYAILSDYDHKDLDHRPIYLGKNVWIGRGTRLHPGVTIGHGSIIGPNSVVTESIPPGVIAGGAPAVILDEARG